MNNTTFLHFPPIIISFVGSLLCCSIMTILLTLVIIRRLSLIIRCIVLSKIIIGWNWRFTRIPITFWFPFIKALCMWKLYTSTNCWKSSTNFRPYTYNLNLIILNRWFSAILSNLFGWVWWIVKSIFFVIVVVWYR